MKRRGFTLIELLAVIVILAIIALIATPIVINIINDSKKESINRSIELYINHVQKMIAKKQMKDPTFNPSKCEINEGNLTCDGKPIQIEMKGQTPKSGTIKFSKGMVIEGVNLELDGLYYQVKNDKISEGTNEKVTSYSDYITLKEDTGATGLSIGDKYDYEVKPGTTHTFYVLSLEGDKVNLIMNSNICNDGTPADKDHQCNYAWHAGTNNNNYGPDTAMTNLYNATKNWNNVPNMELTYIDENNSKSTTIGYTGITINNGVATIEGKNAAGNTRIGTIELPLKARLPREDEVKSEEAGCHGYSSATDYGTCSAWLLENISYDEGTYILWCSTCLTKYEENKTNEIDGVFGYWLLSSSPDSLEGSNRVNIIGYVSSYYTSDTVKAGIRPVITVSKSDLE